MPPADTLPDDDVAPGVPRGVGELYDLVAASPIVMPWQVDGWMRKQDFHLARIIQSFPAATVGFARDANRWIRELAVLGPKIEFLLLTHRADQAGRKWMQGIGSALAPIRAMLPPLGSAAFRDWDPTSLLAEIRVATAARSVRGSKRLGGLAAAGPSARVELGRIPAAQAALFGEPMLVRAPPSTAMGEVPATERHCFVAR